MICTRLLKPNGDIKNKKKNMKDKIKKIFERPSINDENFRKLNEQISQMGAMMSENKYDNANLKKVKIADESNIFSDNDTMNMKHFIDLLIDKNMVINKISVKIPRNYAGELFDALTGSSVDSLDFQISTLGDEILIILK